jgi:hypothetical protein
VCSEVSSAPLETPSVPKQRMRTSVFKRFSRKRYAIVGIIAIGFIVVALFFVPQGVATIPLRVNYTVGERMVHYTTEALSVQVFNATTGQLESNAPPIENSSLSYTDTVDVAGFDGEAYTLKHTMTIEGISGPPASVSFVEEMNQTGYSMWIFPQAPNVGASNRSGVSNPALTGLLERPEVTVGDTWVIPVTTNSSHATMTGNMTLTFVGIQDITVPAGTYKVFRVDSASNDTVIKLTLPHSNMTTITSNNNMTISGQTYIEYDTGRQIESNMHFKNKIQTTTIASPTLEFNSTIQTVQILLEDITTQTHLMQDIQPGANSTPSPLQSPSSVDQSALSFLADVVGLDVGHYTAQFGAVSRYGFVKCTLTSVDSSLDVQFILNNSRVVFCKLYPMSGSPVFAASSTDNVEAAKSFLDRYQSYAQTSYVPAMRNMLDNITGLTSATLSEARAEGAIDLTVSVKGSETDFEWGNTGIKNQYDLFALIFQNGRFEFFSGG